jgi:hypothetical protein
MGCLARLRLRFNRHSPDSRGFARDFPPQRGLPQQNFDRNTLVRSQIFELPQLAALGNLLRSHGQGAPHAALSRRRARARRYKIKIYPRTETGFIWLIGVLGSLRGVVERHIGRGQNPPARGLLSFLCALAAARRRSVRVSQGRCLFSLGQNQSLPGLSSEPRPLGAACPGEML